jgi:hypothetical protein|tara:strand:+ start:3565 stop:3885 length:321 start_codon:yes stop_codon:yes gene_type:complete
MNQFDNLPGKNCSSSFRAKLCAELEGLQLLTIEETLRYGGSMMDLKWLLLEVENAIKEQLTEEQFTENLRSLSFVTFTFAENVLVLCHSREDDYFMAEKDELCCAG